MFSISEVRRFASSQELRKVANTCWCCCCSVDKSCLTLYNPTDCPSLSTGVCSDSCPLSQWCHPTISSSAVPFSPLAFNLSRIGVFPKESALCIRWPKYWSFSFRISPSNKYSGLIYFRINGFDLAVQGILKSLLEHHNLKASVLLCSAFFMVQLSHKYIVTGKTIALTIWSLSAK